MFILEELPDKGPFDTRIVRSRLANWRGMCFALGGTIHLADGAFVEVKAGRCQDLIVHETTHVLQQKKIGIWKFLFFYFFCLPILWNPWRLRWEAEAYAKQLRWLEREGHGAAEIEYLRTAWVEALAGWKYGRPASRARVEMALDEAGA